MIRVELLRLQYLLQRANPKIIGFHIFFAALYEYVIALERLLHIGGYDPFVANPAS